MHKHVHMVPCMFACSTHNKIMLSFATITRVTTTCVMRGVSFVLWSIEVSPRVRELSAVFFSQAFTGADKHG